MNTTTRTLLMLLAYLGMCGWFVFERRANDRAVRSFRMIIHVNGIRGKTSTCRMLDAVLRPHYRVLTKTTGSDPRVIGVDGSDGRVRRLGPASITEQVRTLRRAHRERAEIVILECMATRPDLQAFSQRQIVQSGITVITNVRYDHILDMGGTLDDIAAALAGTIPTRGTLYTADSAYFPFFEEKAEALGSAAVLCPEDAPGHENESIVRAIARAMDIPDASVDAGLARVPRDIGMRTRYETVNARGEPITFLNLFAANDPQSVRQRLAAYAGASGDTVFLYNHRWDRPDRAQLFAQHFFPGTPDARVFLFGENRPLARRLFRRETPTLRVTPIARWQDSLDVPGGTLLVGIGNIKGGAARMLAALGAREGGRGRCMR